MNTYTNLTNWFSYHIEISQSIYELDTLIIENIDYSASYWNADERAHHAKMIVSDLATELHERDCDYEVFWTDNVMSELNELADEHDVIPYKALALAIQLNTLGLQYFAPDVSHARVTLGELVETAGEQITLKGDCVFFTGYMGYSECVGNVISEPTPITPSNLECIYPQLPTFFIQTYRHLSQNIHIVHYVYCNKSALYAFIASNVSEHGDRALCHHMGFSMFNLNVVTSFTQISAKFFRAMLAKPVPTKHNF